MRTPAGLYELDADPQRSQLEVQRLTKPLHRPLAAVVERSQGVSHPAPDGRDAHDGAGAAGPHVWQDSLDRLHQPQDVDELDLPLSPLDLAKALRDSFAESSEALDLLWEDGADKGKGRKRKG